MAAKRANRAAVKKSPVRKKPDDKKQTGPPGELKKILANLGDIEEWARAGVSNRQIAKNLGISESTWYKHKSETSEILETLLVAAQALKEERVTSVESEMYKRAQGFYAEEIVTTIGGNLERPQVRKINKYIPADLGLQRWIMTNRKGLEWKEKPIMEGDGNGDKDRAAIRRSIEGKLARIASGRNTGEVSG